MVLSISWTRVFASVLIAFGMYVVLVVGSLGLSHRTMIDPAGAAVAATFAFPILAALVAAAILGRRRR